MVNDLLSDPCAYGQRKKVLMLAYSPPNESPILRILGMNNRNKITFKMLHLTVDARRLQWLQSFPTAHISHLQQARWFHTGGPWCVCRKRHDAPHKIWISILLQDLPMHAHLLSGGPAALPRPLGSAWAQTPSVWEDAVTIRNTFFLLESESDFQSHSEVNQWLHLLVFWPFWPCVMIN